jgi:hypothetical protein
VSTAVRHRDPKLLDVTGAEHAAVHRTTTCNGFRRRLQLRHNPRVSAASAGNENWGLGTSCRPRVSYLM